MAKSAQINKHLEKVINDLLKEVNEKEEDKDGKKVFKHSLTDRCKVIDRAIKLEALKMSQDDSGYGSGFDEPPEPEDDK